ncbi:MAG: helix-turn-helix domain-containing protein [Bacteroidota bacterium]
MKALSFEPSPALKPFIRTFMSLQGHFHPAPQQHITPKGEPALFFPFRAPARFGQFVITDKIRANITNDIDQGMLLGQSNTYALGNWQGWVNLIIVPLQPVGLQHFLKETSAVMTNSIFTLGSMNMPAYFQELQDQLWEVEHPAIAKNLVEKYLLKHFYPVLSGLERNSIADITNWINYHSGVFPVTDLMKKFKVSRRRLEQQFATQVGLSPKDFSRVIRFRSVIRQMHLQPEISWMRMVADFNYTDQSHLIRDFRQFAGVTPTVLFEEKSVFEQLAYKNAFM